MKTERSSDFVLFCLACVGACVLALISESLWRLLVNFTHISSCKSHKDFENMKRRHGDDNSPLVLPHPLLLVLDASREAQCLPVQKAGKDSTLCHAAEPETRRRFTLYFLPQTEHSWKEERWRNDELLELAEALETQRWARLQAKKAVNSWPHSKAVGGPRSQCWFPSSCALNPQNAMGLRS